MRRPRTARRVQGGMAALVLVAAAAAWAGAPQVSASPAVGPHERPAGARASSASVLREAKPTSVISVPERCCDWGPDLKYAVWLSPDGDHVGDKTRVEFTLTRRSTVTVKVVRRTQVYKERLGTLPRGSHTWTWRGRNAHGRVVRDGAYTAVLVADQVAPGGKTRRAFSRVFVDTRFDASWAPELTGDTVYPATTIVRDLVGYTLGNDTEDPFTMLGKGVMRLEDARGDKVWSRSVWYHTSRWPALADFTGRDENDFKPLPAGDYRLRFTMRDMAGNPGGTKSVLVHVSDKPLVQATGSITVPPTGSWKATGVPAGIGATTASATGPGESRDGRVAMRGGDDPTYLPCGVVVPSDVYSDPGAMSFRSADTCPPTWPVVRLPLAGANGQLELDTLPPEVAPRGLQESWLSMRGRPTQQGETDTAQLYSWPSPWANNSLSGPHAASAAVAGETVTSTQPRTYPYERPYFAGYRRVVDWSIVTRGVDSYDVAAVTVHYTYLTPQP